MPDANPPPHGGEEQSLSTRLSHAGRPGTHVLGFVNPPVHRGSTVLYPTMDDRRAAGRKRFDQAWVYGTHGSPTHHALEDVVAEIEGGTRCQLTSSGLSAITTPLLAFLSAGDHLLVPDSCYGPTRNFCDAMLTRMGVATTYYDPCADAAGLDTLFRPETKVLFVESPGSHTFEVQDVPALAAVAHARGAKVLMDNTWGIHFFQPFSHGVDVSIQALTKYVAGHSDVLLGGVTTNSTADWEKVRRAAIELGQYASPDDCWLALRGARTLAVRLKHQMQSALEVAGWLENRAEVMRVLHPALPSCPGHRFWQRDFSGACSLFGFVLQPGVKPGAVDAMVNALALFGIGASWGGYESLILPSEESISRSCGTGAFGGPMLRIHVGLEEVTDLTADLARGFAALAAFRA